MDGPLSSLWQMSFVVSVMSWKHLPLAVPFLCGVGSEQESSRIRPMRRAASSECVNALARNRGLQRLLDRYGLPYVAYNQGSIVHLECSGVMLMDMRHPIKLFKESKARKRLMEQLGAAYTAHGIITLAGSRMYTSMADTDEVIDDALARPGIGELGEPEPLEQLADRARRAEADVRGNRQMREERVVLEDEADAPPLGRDGDPPGGVEPHLVAERDPPGLGTEQTGDGAQDAPRAASHFQDRPAGFACQVHVERDILRTA